jgi:hypothetical protein
MKPIELGDFQTPGALAEQVLQVVRRQPFVPRSVLEPTVGTGQLLAAALRSFRSCTQAAGFDINPEHLREARERARTSQSLAGVTLDQADIFSIDLDAVVLSLPPPVLIVGNPPWVTNARQGSIGTSNLPVKSNFEQRRGIDAITGKANFDISEWIILRLLQALARSQGVLAMLCKTRVARRILAYAAQHALAIEGAEMYAIDASAHFGAAVDACLFLCRSGTSKAELACNWYEGLGATAPSRNLLFLPGIEVADARAFLQERPVYRQGCTRWRSGIKHDCTRVMEFEARADGLCNGEGERVDLEPDFLFPLLKGADLIAAHPKTSRFVLVPQRTTGEDTSRIESAAPRTWQYLMDHRQQLRSRASRIFAGRPDFSVFGVGDYTFSPWKLAVPALHKALVIRVVGPRERRPVVFDDTCYLLACRNEAHARVLHALLGLPRARALLESLVFWADKRPVRADCLGSVDVAHLAVAHRENVLKDLRGKRGIEEELDRIAKGEG